MFLSVLRINIQRRGENPLRWLRFEKEYGSGRAVKGYDLPAEQFILQKRGEVDRQPPAARSPGRGETEGRSDGRLRSRSRRGPGPPRSAGSSGGERALRPVGAAGVPRPGGADAPGRLPPACRLERRSPQKACRRCTPAFRTDPARGAPHFPGNQEVLRCTRDPTPAVPLRRPKRIPIRPCVSWRPWRPSGSVPGS